MNNQFSCQLPDFGQGHCGKWRRACSHSSKKRRKIARGGLWHDSCWKVWAHQRREDDMARFETICCVTMLGLMNALLIAVAIGTADPIDRSPSAQIAQMAHTAPAVKA
jgi:hypothetical protein